MPSTARPYQALRLVSQRIRWEAWLMIWTLKPETHSSSSSHSSQVSLRTTIASVQLMLPWHEAKRAACSIASIFQSSTVAVGVEVADAAAVAERLEERDVGDLAPPTADLHCASVIDVASLVVAYTVIPRPPTPRRTRRTSGCQRAHARRDRDRSPASASCAPRWRLIDERGLDQLTMRRLGARPRRRGDVALQARRRQGGDPRRRARAAAARSSRPRLRRGPGAVDWRDDLAASPARYRALGRAHPEAFGLLARGPERAYVAGRAHRRGRPRAAHRRRASTARTAILAQRTIVRFVLGVRA